eukprot:tig00020553_g10642.t1
MTQSICYARERLALLSFSKPAARFEKFGVSFVLGHFASSEKFERRAWGRRRQGHPPVIETSSLDPQQPVAIVAAASACAFMLGGIAYELQAARSATVGRPLSNLGLCSALTAPAVKQT